MEEILRRKEGESLFDYYKRITLGKKEFDIDYIEWGNIILQEDNTYSSENLRKAFYVVEKMFKKLENENIKNISDDSLLEEVKNILGELDIKKQEVRNKTNKLNRIKREFVKTIELSNDLKRYMKENNFTVVIPEYCNNEINVNKQDYTMILNISDLHIGCVINNCKSNYYNYEVAKKRIDKLIDECYKYIEMYNIKKIYLINTGDTIEHNSMRKNQYQYCEFGQSEQINKAIDLIYYLIISLCKYCYVEYDSIAGNHDRMNGDYSANYDGDNADNIITEQIRKYNELSGNKRANIIKRNHTDKEIIKEINGLKCKFIHGDSQNNKDGKTILKNEISMDDDFYDILFQGHWHNFKLESENNKRYIVTTGCLSGYNDFSKRFGCSTVASQTIAIIGNNQVEMIKDVQLN
ncbi:hypothetical protein [Clostridium sp. CTA-6]